MRGPDNQSHSNAFWCQPNGQWRADTPGLLFHLGIPFPFLRNTAKIRLSTGLRANSTAGRLSQPKKCQPNDQEGTIDAERTDAN